MSVFPPLLLPHARGLSRARTEPSPAAVPTKLAAPSRFPGPQPSSLHPAPPTPYPEPEFAVPQPESHPQRPAAINPNLGAPSLSSTSTLQLPSVRLKVTVSFPLPYSYSPSLSPRKSLTVAGGTPPRAPWHHCARCGPPLRGLARCRRAPRGRLGPWPRARPTPAAGWPRPGRTAAPPRAPLRRRRARVRGQKQGRALRAGPAPTYMWGPAVSPPLMFSFLFIWLKSSNIHRNF